MCLEQLLPIFGKCNTDPMTDSSLLLTGTFEFPRVEDKKG